MGCRFKYVSCVKASFVCVCNNFMYIGVLTAYVCIRVLETQELELQSYKVPCGCWDPVEEQPVFVSSEPSLQPQETVS